MSKAGRKNLSSCLAERGKNMIASFTFGYGVALTHELKIIPEEKALERIDAYKKEGYKAQLTGNTVFIWKK